ncbi:MAG: hypothetical protein ACLTST_03655 [Lachnospiraceae bacterium]
MEKSDGTEKEKPLEQPKKRVYWKSCTCYQQEGRQQPKRSVKKNLWMMNDKKEAE